MPKISLRSAVNRVFNVLGSLYNFLFLPEAAILEPIFPIALNTV